MIAGREAEEEGQILWGLRGHCEDFGFCTK